MTAVMGIAGRYYRKIGISEKFLFFDVFLLKRCGKGSIELARERLAKAVNRLGVVRRNGRSRKVNWPDPHGPDRWEGQHRQLIREPEERGGVPQALERHLGGPPGLMKIFKLR